MKCCPCCPKRTEAEGHNCTLKFIESDTYLPEWQRTKFLRALRALKKSTLISETNPQSTEFYRSKTLIQKLRIEQIASGTWIIHPFSDFRIYYELWMTVMWLLMLFYLPFESAFDIHNRSHHTMLDDVFTGKDHYDYLGLFLRMIGFCDIIVTFFTGFCMNAKRKIIMEPQKIVKNYVMSVYFVTDLLASIPFEFMVKDPISERLFSCFGFLRIIRLRTLNSYMYRSLDTLRIRTLQVESMVQIVIHFLVFHWATCSEYLMPQIRFFMTKELQSSTWIERDGVPETSIFTRYLMSFYRAVGSLFCVYMDEDKIKSWENKFLHIILFIVGKIYIFFLSVLILHHLLRQRSLEIKYFEIISQVQAYMSQKQFPINMQTRLLQFYDYRYNKKFFKERKITSLLSDKLKAEINLNVCSKLVQNVELLSHLPNSILEQVVTNLKPEIYLPNDIIIKAGSVGDCMYFLSSGTVGVWTPSGKEVCHLQDGAYFGEISLVFKDKRRTASVAAVEICKVYKLERKAFRNFFRTNAKLYRTLEEVATERMEVTQMFEEVHANTLLDL